MKTKLTRASRAIILLLAGGLALASIACGDPATGPEDVAPTATAEADAPAGEAAAPPNEDAATPSAPQKQFPPQDHLNKIVTAYTVANQHPDLLTGLPCYCPCELYGHGGVIDCHRSQHAAMCNICMDEAIEAGQLYEAQLARGEADIAAVQAQVKDRYRRGLVAQTARQYPMMNTQQGQAFLQACSDCHQPPSPAMHTAGDWDKSLDRMAQYAREKNAMPSDQIWEGASSYVKSVATQVPASNVAQMRQSLESTVENLKRTEGDAAYYPSVRDEVLDPVWAARMATAYSNARSLPAELLASTPTTCEACVRAGETNLLACLNSWQAIVCETAIEEVERLVETQGQGQ